MEKRTSIPRELVKKLNENPNVKRATEWSVTFTEEFKKHAYEEYSSGKRMKQIFTEAGFDVEDLGDHRIQNFRNKLVENAARENGFEDGRKSNSRKEAQSTEAQMARRIRELEHRNAYLEQENDFLKKIQSLEKDCGRKAAKQK